MTAGLLRRAFASDPLMGMVFSNKQSRIAVGLSIFTLFVLWLHAALFGVAIW